MKEDLINIAVLASCGLTYLIGNINRFQQLTIMNDPVFYFEYDDD